MKITTLKLIIRHLLGIKSALEKDLETQTNSFACKVCGQVFTEESGAFRGFTCDVCLDELEKGGIK